MFQVSKYIGLGSTQLTRPDVGTQPNTDLNFRLLTESGGQSLSPISQNLSSLTTRLPVAENTMASLSETKPTFVYTLRDYLQNALPGKNSKFLKTAGLKKEPKQVVDPSKIDGEIKEAVRQSAQAHGVREELVLSVIKAESNFNPKARSRVGAMGLMQLMPGTARELGVKNAYDIRENVDGGVRYLKKMLDRFQGDEKLALAAYNAGPGAVEKHGGVPPYRETRQYVRKILDSVNQVA